MQDLLSPKQVASSIGVSESSLKRWCDQGVITTERTPGGHRRIRVREVIRFLRAQSHPLVSPEVLGLPAGAGRRVAALETGQEALLAALEAGEHTEVRRVILGHYLAGETLLGLCERLLAPTLYTIGDRWECGHTEVYQERRACESISRVLFELRSFLSPADPLAPTAMGGSPPGDHYRLATMMVELVLAEEGWNATSLGSSLPFATLAAAAQRHEPQLFWLSISYVPDADELSRGFGEFLRATPVTMPVVVGGRESLAALTDVAHRERVHTGANLTALREIAQTVCPVAVSVPTGSGH
jgi:excisionase family DNA binding protein